MALGAPPTPAHLHLTTRLGKADSPRAWRLCPQGLSPSADGHPCPQGGPSGIVPSYRALPLSAPHSEFSQLHRLLPFGVGVEKTAPLKANLLPTALHGAASRAAPAALRGATSSEKARNPTAGGSRAAALRARGGVAGHGHVRHWAGTRARGRLRKRPEPER